MIALAFALLGFVGGLVFAPTAEAYCRTVVLLRHVQKVLVLVAIVVLLLKGFPDLPQLELPQIPWITR